MYSLRITELQTAQMERAHRVKLKRYEPQRCEEMALYLKALIADQDQKTGEVKSLKRLLTDEEQAFILNEQLLCKVDFEYWALRYATITKDGVEGGGMGKLNMWDSQRRLMSVISEVEEKNWASVAKGQTVDGIRVALNKARQLGACLIAGTRVLTTDLRWKPIEDISIGDSLVAFDEETQGQGKSRHLVRASVVDRCCMEAPTYKLTLDDGTVFRGTPHHRFLTWRPSGHPPLQWIAIEKMRLGDKIRRIVRPWEPGESYEDGWFGGFLDGEGSCSLPSRSGAEISGAQTPGDVLNRAIRYLVSRGYNFHTEIDNRKGGESSKLGNKPIHKLCISKMADIFKLIGQTRPSRFLLRPWYEGKEMSKDGDAYATVVSVEKSIVQPVYDIQTTTGTYIAEGFASHNTMLSRSLMMHRLTMWPDHRAMSASVDDDKVMELYDRDKLILDGLPFYLRPSMGFDVKGAHIYFDKINSRVLYQQGNQQSGLGQGRQFELGHLTECASFNYPLRIEHDFFPTLPQSPNTLCLLESTPQGRGDWWHDFTEDVRAGHRVEWRYVFIPWYVELKKYRRTPPDGWNPSALSLQHAARVRESSFDLLGRKVELTKDQLYWYETTRYGHQKAGTLNVFLTNYCATHEESFQHIEQSAIAVEIIEKLRLNIGTGKPYEIEQVVQ